MPLAAIINDGEKNASDVSENIDQMSGPEVTKDKAGVTFDPELHATDKDGNPIITKAGYFRKKSGPKTKAQQAQDPDFNQTDVNLEGLNAGLVASELSFMMGQAVFGPDGKPTEQEAQALPGICEMALADMGVENLSPKWLYVAFMSGYSLARINKPQVQGRLKKIMAGMKKGLVKIKSFLKNRFSKGY